MLRANPVQTLSFVIRAIENTQDWRNQFFTQQSDNSNNNSYLEEYEINMSDTRIHDHTNEIVTLASGANTYAVPLPEGTQNNATLTCTFEANTAGIKFGDKNNETETWTLKEEQRIIPFIYPLRNGAIHTVNKNGSSIPTATILVKKTVSNKTFNIAKFKINFLPYSTLLTQTLVEQIETGQTTDTEWNNYKFRIPAYLEKNYHLVTELNFDYDPDVASQYGEKQVYPFPFEWLESSYAFFDGSPFVPNGTKKDFANINANTRVPQWGYYAILNDYVENGSTVNGNDTQWGYGPAGSFQPPLKKLINSQGQPSTYHMFTDASDRPGRIARIEFHEKPCKGSEIFISAWVKVARKYNQEGYNAAMLFSLMGVDKDNTTYTPIYRYQTGQIPGTYNGSSVGIPGFGNNEWMHVYFSFINEQDEDKLDFDHYALQIDNYSTTTQGGDQYLDDVRIYVMPPHARVEQKNDFCDNHALLRTRIGWHRLLSRIGEKEYIEGSSEEGPATEYVKFCFIDSLKYEEAIKNNSSDKAAAVKAAAVHFHYPINSDDGDKYGDKMQISKVSFSTLFEGDKGNPAYNHEDDWGNKQADPNNIKAFSYTDEAGEKFLALDIQAELQPFRPYILMLAPCNENDTFTDDDTIWQDFIPAENDPCQIRTDFKVESQKVLRVNGELLTPETEFCAGQVLDFKVELRADATRDGIYNPQTIITDATYDWFFGTAEEFNTKEDNTDNDKLTVRDALIAFRNSGNESLDKWSPTGDLDSKQKNLLQELVTNKKLILNQPKISLTLNKDDNDEFNMVIRLVPNRPDDQTVICADPLEISLKITGNAPIAKVGFGDVTYPDMATDTPAPTYRSVVRIGKEQLNKVNAESSLLRIPLRGVGTNTEGETGSDQPLTKTDNPYLYLIDSNDPAVTKVIQEQEAFQLTDWPVAQIETFQAIPGTSDNNDKGDYMDCYFPQDENGIAEGGLGKVNFREGYWYTLMAQFYQKAETGEEISEDNEDTEGNTSLCQGQLLFDLKVVPEYQKWIGAQDGSGNWNNDANWQRSTGLELKKSDTDAASYDQDYNVDTERPYTGFVPMDFTHVTMPTGSKALLYKAETKTNIDPDTHPILDLATEQVSDPATQYIEYDLMVKTAENIDNVAHDCRTYYTNTCQAIHFEPSAEMQNAHFLTYDKVWVDYKLDKGVWHALASPLENMVAGDWYTEKDGTQDTEYFKEITFGDGTTYSRLTPAVYQRSWDNQAKMIPLGETTDGSKDVAIQGTWSGVFNSVDHSYTKNYAFSVKTLCFTDDKAIFRMPKNDLSYSYYDADGNKSGQSVSVRSEGTTSRLLSDKLNNTDNSPAFTVELENKTKSDYYLVGNPFIAHLDLEKFFEMNSDLEKKAYSTPNGETQVVVSGDLSTDAGVSLIAPLQSFFVKKAETATKADVLTVYFTAEMQVLESNAPDTETPVEPVLRLTATTDDGRQHKAILAYDPSASANYAPQEDAELFIDSHLEGLPMVYTVAGNMAASINRTPDLWNIPLGIHGGNDQAVNLTFNGLGRFSGTILYDAEKQTETPIYEGYTLRLTGNTHGRYFLRSGTPTGTAPIRQEEIRIYSLAGGKLIVTATEELQSVSIYDFSGRLLQAHNRLSDHQFTTDLPKGNYIIRAASKHRQRSEKVRIL